MSGVFGLISTRHKPALSLLERMGERCALHPWFRVNTWREGDAALGQVNIGLFSAGEQPAQRGPIHAVFFGQLHNAEALRREAERAQGSPVPAGEAALIAALYALHGADFPARLEGVFAAAVWDAEGGELLLANDRYGLLPHYYAHFGGRLAFAPQMAALSTLPGFHKELDLDAVADFIRFQRLLGDKTFFTGIRLLPYGSLLRYRPAEDRLEIAHYWDFDHTPAWSGASFEEAVEETARLLENAVAKRLRSPFRAGVYLSGGLDSRTILGFAERLGKRLPSVTYGHPRSRDVQYGLRIARRLHSPNRFFPQTDGRWMEQFAPQHLRAIEGQQAFLHAHASITLGPVREQSIMQVNLSGFNGDQLVGGRAITYAANATQAPDDTAFLALWYHNLNQRFSWPGITEAEEKLLYTPSWHLRMRERSFESLKEALRPFANFSPPRRVDYFSAIHQGARLSNLNVVYQRGYFEACYPFYDYALMDYIHSMPVEYRLHDRLYLAVITRAIPKVTWIPRESDGQLPTARRMRRAAYGLGQKIWRRTPFFREQQILHGDPEDWLRNDLRQWAADILFDERTLQRGIFSPDFLRSIYARHMGGHEQWTIGKIAPLITLEMMLREFFDG
ncbi:MAG TPA: asparagine synthetase B family protein [Chloroflexi bacterium]|nr:asparagine synthetase B family protein [Chloroflexota bacterium]